MKVERLLQRGAGGDGGGGGRWGRIPPPPGPLRGYRASTASSQRGRVGSGFSPVGPGRHVGTVGNRAGPKRRPGPPPRKRPREPGATGENRGEKTPFRWGRRRPCGGRARQMAGATSATAMQRRWHRRRRLSRPRGGGGEGSAWRRVRAKGPLGCPQSSGQTGKADYREQIAPGIRWGLVPPPPPGTPRPRRELHRDNKASRGARVGSEDIPHMVVPMRSVGGSGAPPGLGGVGWGGHAGRQGRSAADAAETKSTAVSGVPPHPRQIERGLRPPPAPREIERGLCPPPPGADRAGCGGTVTPSRQDSEPGGGGGGRIP